MSELIRGRYQALEVVGRGGQGEVVRARDSLHDRQVALKVRPVPTPEEREAVLSEARVLLDVRPHAGLPLVREDFYVGARYYLVMDWVEGKSLQQVVEERGDPGLAFGVVVGYLRQVAAALDHLHAHEPPVVHGDVKPSNLILTPRGQVVLVDFGVAVNEVAARRIAMGTRGYVAPELASDARPTPAADVYSLAATAYTLLTGHPPGPDDAEGIGTGRPDWELARALRGALSTDPVRRPASASELVAGLEGAAPGTRPAGILTFLAVDAPAGGTVQATVERHGGVVAGGAAPPVLGVFARASDAIGCALALQDGLDDLDLPGEDTPPVRMALHTGEAERDQDDYRGGAVERAAAMCAVAADGQILVSQITRQLAHDSLLEGVSLDPVGVRPDGASHSERVFELSRATGSEPALDSSGSVTVPFDRLPTAALAPPAPPEPAPPRHRPTPPTRPTQPRLRAGVVVGFLVVAVVAGGLVWAAGNRDGSPGSPAGDLSAGTTPSTTSAPTPLPPGTGAIPAGRYRTATFTPALSFTADGTWRSLKGEFGDIVDLVQTSGPETNLLTVVRVGQVYDAALAPATVDEMDQAATVAPADLGAWLASHPRLQVASEPIEIGGRPGVRLDVEVRPGAGYPGARCPSRCVVLFALDTPGRLFELLEGNRNRLDVLPIDGATLVLAIEAPPPAFDDFRAAVDRLGATVTA